MLHELLAGFAYSSIALKVLVAVAVVVFKDEKIMKRMIVQVIRLPVIEGPNVRDCDLCIAFIFSGPPDEHWLHACRACALALRR